MAPATGPVWKLALVDFHVLGILFISTIWADSPWTLRMHTTMSKVRHGLEIVTKRISSRFRFTAKDTYQSLVLLWSSVPSGKNYGSLLAVTRHICRPY